MPTPREQLAIVLRQARLNAGFDSQGKLAAAMHLSRTVVVKAESPNSAAPSDAVLVAWNKATGVDLAELVDLAQRVRSGTPEWFMPYLSAEAVATSLRFWGPFVIPGLLQTEAYARALVSVEKRTPAQLGELVRIRMDRQQVIGRASVTAVIDHRALVHAIGSPAIMAEQCGHLAALAESQQISLHVVSEGANIGLGGAVAIVSRGVHVTVSLTTPVRDITSTDAVVVEDALRLFDAVLGTAMGPVPSVEFVRTYEAKWKGQA